MDVGKILIPKTVFHAFGDGQRLEARHTGHTNVGKHHVGCVIGEIGFKIAYMRTSGGEYDAGSRKICLRRPVPSPKAP